MTTETETNALITQLLSLLDSGNAHVTLEAAVEGIPPEQRGTVPPGLPYSLWGLLEHLRITQRDILNFCSPPSGGYKEREWPAGYWPVSAEPPSPTAWDETLTAVAADMESLKALIRQPDADLYTPFPWGKGQNLLREILLGADHNSYHTAEIVAVRRLLGSWNK